MPPQFSLYGNRGAISAERVRLLLSIGNFTDYTFISLEPSDSSLKTISHLSLHPFGRIPALTMADGFTVFESRPICAFLARTFKLRDQLDKSDSNLLLPVEGGDGKSWARFEEAQSVEMCYFNEPATILSLELFSKPLLGLGETDIKTVEKAKAALEVWAEGLQMMFLKRIQAENESSGFMARKEFSLVDIYYIPLIHRMLDCGLEEVMMGDGKEEIKKWWRRCLQREKVNEWVKNAVTREMVLLMMKRREAKAVA
jgi:glutathione S-transferase